MTSETNDKMTRFLLSIICVTAYFLLFLAVLAQAYDTNLDHLLGV